MPIDDIEFEPELIEPTGPVITFGQWFDETFAEIFGDSKEVP